MATVRKGARKTARKGAAATGTAKSRKLAALVDEGPPSEPGTTTLVVVESPAKAKTIGKYLGRGYRVRATIGHVRDLPEKKIGIDIENGFEPEYVTIPGKEKTLADLKSVARDSREILLATDPDREGEAIAWHVAGQIRRKKAARQSGAFSFTRSPATQCRRRSPTPARSTSARSTRSRRAAFSTASSATKRARFSGRR